MIENKKDEEQLTVDFIDMWFKGATNENEIYLDCLKAAVERLGDNETVKLIREAVKAFKDGRMSFEGVDDYSALSVKDNLFENTISLLEPVYDTDMAETFLDNVIDLIEKQGGEATDKLLSERFKLALDEKERKYAEKRAKKNGQ